MARQRMNVQAPIERLFADRWSTRAFDRDRPVSREALAACLEAARWAPSCFGEEPWRFIVADRSTDEAAWQTVFDTLAPKNQLWARNVPVLIVTACEPSFSQSREANRWCEYDAGQAAICLCLQATALGLASHQMGGFDPGALKQALGLPDQMHVMSIVALGHAGRADELDPDFQGMESAPRNRKPIEDVVHTGKWGESWTPPEAPGWQARYEETPAEKLPWFHPELDPDFAAALERLDIKSGPAFDIGCGPGTQAIALARLGFEVTAVDVAGAAIEGAEKRAAEAGVTIDFTAGDILSMDIDRRFDLVLDRGVLHCFADEERRRKYIARIRHWLKPGGILLLKCFSHEETREEGPPCRFSPDDIRTMFREGFTIVELKPTVFPAAEDPPRALFTGLRRD
ncbi:MAG: nitroreductase family protein [Mariprofundaceae bacterium]|nr:nitroreductase family protein [Mariprofundaceae bacterium]